MNFLIISHTPHTFKNGRYYAYGPYIKEMDLWLKYVDTVEVVAPHIEKQPLAILLPYKTKEIKFSAVPAIFLVSFSEILQTLFRTPLIFLRIYVAMKRADHIHLRCPGNIGLIGGIIQIFFPKKKKTAKYAGNWNPNAKQPWSYRLQKWILSNTFLTRNMTVLVYGKWSGQTKNVLPFFTASYSENKIEEVQQRRFSEKIRFVFVGTLSKGKRPLYALQIVDHLLKRGVDCTLDFYGEGEERSTLQKYINENKLGSFITLHGNQSSEVVEVAYKRSHFLILPSQSEGWPKVVAEAMFFGAVPLATKISCVPWMLEEGNRGILLTLDIEKDTGNLISLLREEEILMQMSKEASRWSNKYTMERFEKELKKLI